MMFSGYTVALGIGMQRAPFVAYRMIFKCSQEKLPKKGFGAKLSESSIGSDQVDPHLVDK